DLARPADDGALGHRRPRSRRGHRSREGAGLPDRLPLHEEPHRCFHQPAAAQHRQAFAWDEAARHRPFRRHNAADTESRLMDSFDLSRRLAAEALGTCILVTTVVGSGIMAESLTKDIALALLCNTLPTGAILVVLITILGPISGAHFNPAVSLVFALRRELTTGEALSYVAAQIAGGTAGNIMAHAMFDPRLSDG